MTKKLLLFIPSLIILLCLSACGLSAPNKAQLKNMIPFEIRQYELDGDLYVSEITDIEIVRQQTNEKSDIADCVVTLTDERLKRTVYITLNSNYWDTGGWMLESYEINQAETYEIIGDIIYDTNYFISEIDMLGFQRTSETCVIEEDGYSCYTYTVAEELSYLSYRGVVTAMAELKKASYDGSTVFYWETNLDTSDISYNWSIVGHWRAENVPALIRNTAHYQINWLDLTITEAEVTPILYYDGYYSHKYEYEQQAYWNPSKWVSDDIETDGLKVFGENPSDLYLELKGLLWCIRIYPSYAIMANVETDMHGTHYGEFAPFEKLD